MGDIVEDGWWSRVLLHNVNIPPVFAAMFVVQYWCSCTVRSRSLYLSTQHRRTELWTLPARLLRLRTGGHARRLQGVSVPRQRGVCGDDQRGGGLYQLQGGIHRYDLVSSLLLLPYTGLGPFWVLKVQSKLVRLGRGGGVCSLKTVNVKQFFIKILIKLFYDPMVIKKLLLWST